MTIHLLTAPQELLIRILSYLDAISLLRSAMTCKDIYDALRNSSMLQYTIQLHLDGLEGIGTSSTHSELIERLLRRRQAWHSLKWTGYATRELQSGLQHYEFIGGVFANSNGRHLEILWLPSANNVKGYTVKRDMAGISVVNFTMDPTQDMIALLEDLPGPISPTNTNSHIKRIHIRTLSTNDTHPAARQNPLHFYIIPAPGDSDSIFKVHLKIVRNTLSIYFCHGPIGKLPRARVLIWDWTTSELIVDSSVHSSLQNLGDYHFGLLDSTFCFITSSDNSGSILLYKLERSSATNSPTIHLATLHLPPIAPDVKIVNIFANAGPVEANPLPHTPFMVNDDDRLHVFTILYNNLTKPRKVMYFNMFIHQRVFIKYCRRQHTRHEAQPLDIPWVEWGPPNTKMIYPACTQIHCSRYVHGQRVVIPGYRTGRDSAQMSNFIEVLDFSSAAVLSAKGVTPVPPSSNGSNPGMLMSSSTIHTCQSQLPIFQDDVETHLPCVSFKRDVEQPCPTCMISGDGIASLHVRPKLSSGSQSRLL